MCHSRPVAFSAVVGCIICLLSVSHSSADFGGGDRPERVYRGRLSREGADECVFAVVIDRVQFYAATWHGKYRLVRVRVDNEGAIPVVLSSVKDRVEAIIEGEAVAAVLQPAKAAPEQWDLLDETTRKRIAYPRQIKAREHTYFYVLFPADKLTDLPELLKFHINSVDAVIEAEVPEVAER